MKGSSSLARVLVLPPASGSGRDGTPAILSDTGPQREKQKGYVVRGVGGALQSEEQPGTGYC